MEQSAIEKLADGDEEFIKELKQTIKSEIQFEINHYSEELTNEMKANWIHKAKSKIALLEMNELNDEAVILEKRLRNDENCDDELRVFVNAYQGVLKKM